MTVLLFINLSRAQTRRALADFQAVSTSEGTLLCIMEIVRGRCCCCCCGILCCFDRRRRDLAGLWHARLSSISTGLGLVSELTMGTSFCHIGFHNKPYHNTYVRSWAKKWSLGCGNFLPGPAWLLLSKTGPRFGPSLYMCVGRIWNCWMVSH